MKLERLLLPLLFITLIASGCASVENKARLLSFGSEGIYYPKYTYIFIPGLGFTGKFWTKSKAMGLLKRDGWKFGGDIKILNQNGNISIKPGKHTKGQFYVITFSGTQLAISEQGRELARAIEYIKGLSGKDKVVLVGHSMGGLAAREYMQSPYYRDDVAAYMSIGTPHLGSNFELRRPFLRLIPKFIQDRFWDVDERGDAVRDLRTDSIYLNGGWEKDSPNYYRSKDINGNGRIDDFIVGLNQIDKRPVPKDSIYLSVVGGGNAVISTMRQSRVSDGIVDIDSQDLNEVPKMNVNSFVIVSESDHFGEANDIRIFMQAARFRQFLTRAAEMKAQTLEPKVPLEDEAPF